MKILISDAFDPSLPEKLVAFGEVTDAKVITDRETGRSRGFGFVEIGTITPLTAMLERRAARTDPSEAPRGE